MVVGVVEGGGESGRTEGEVEQYLSAERNQPSDAPDTWQSIGKSPPRQRERRPGERRCHPTRNMTGRSARKSGRGSEQDHHHLSSLLRQTTDGQTKQDYV